MILETGTIKQWPPLKPDPRFSAACSCRLCALRGAFSVSRPIALCSLSSASEEVERS